MAITQNISTLTNPINRNTMTPAEISTAGDTTVTELQTIFSQQNTLSGQINTVSAEIAAHAVSTAADVVTSAQSVEDAAAQVSLATTQADNAATSAATALSAPGTSATSTTSLSITVAPKSLTIQTGKSLVVGMTVKITSESSGGWMLGDITGYDTGTGALTVDVANISGSGTLTDWIVSLSAPIIEAPGYTKILAFNSFT